MDSSRVAWRYRRRRREERKVELEQVTGRVRLVVRTIHYGPAYGASPA